MWSGRVGSAHPPCRARVSGEVIERQDIAPDIVADVVVRCRWEMVLPRPVFNPTHKGYLFSLFEECGSNVSFAYSVGGWLATSPPSYRFSGAPCWGIVELELPYRSGQDVPRMQEEEDEGADPDPMLYVLIKGELARRFRSSLDTPSVRTPMLIQDDGTVSDDSRILEESRATRKLIPSATKISS